mgnify:CR=1 FL=1
MGAGGLRAAARARELRHAVLTATNASLLIGVEPPGIALPGALVLNERLGRGRILALALGTIGATVLVVDGIPS